MLLQRLKEYAETRMILPPPLYVEAPVRYVIDLDNRGRLLNFEPIDTASQQTRRGKPRLVPSVTRTSGISTLLLVDKAEYTLGLVSEKSKPDRVAEAHRQYLELLAKCLAVTGEPSVQAVQLFLSSDPLSQLQLPADFDPGALITFRVDGIFPVDLPAVQSFWAAEKDPSADPNNPPSVMQCIVCGQERPVLESLQGNIKRVPGGQTSGTAIISANADAFLSYGLRGSTIAPTCPDCGEKFTKGANELLASRQNRLTVGNMAFIFWTREEVGFSPFELLDDPREETVREVLTSVWKGGRLPEVDETAFYATSLSGSGGRAVVRDWIDTTVGEVRRQLDSWFRRQEIVGPFGEEARPLGLRDLGSATVRDLNDLPVPTSRTLLRAALMGTPLPMDLLYQAVRRNRAEQSVVPPRTSHGYRHKRMALIKLVLLSQGAEREEDHMVQLDPENANPAYRCGRLLAVLEEAQRLAIPGLKATLVDRFYGAASSAPASVYGRLFDTARAHLSKLKRDRPGAYVALERRIEEILGGIDANGGFPRTLTLQDQAVFALGYYHQRAFDRAKAIQARERREQLPGTAEPEAEEQLALAIQQSEEGMAS